MVKGLLERYSNESITKSYFFSVKSPWVVSSLFGFQVCLIERKVDKRIFAMKYVNKESCVGLSAVSNVIQEVELLRSLDHPLITNMWYTFQVR